MDTHRTPVVGAAVPAGDEIEKDGLVDADRSQRPDPDAPETADGALVHLRAVIVDDELPIRKLLRALLDLDERFEIVAEAGTIDAALEAVAEHQPDVVLLDLLLGGEHGGDAIPRMVLDAPHAMVLVLSALSSEDQADRVFSAGAFAYLEKSVMGRRLPEEVAALRARFDRALAGETVWAVSDPGRVLS